MYTNLIYTSQKTHFSFKTNCLTLFRKKNTFFFPVILIQSVEKIRSFKILKHVVHFVISVPEHRYLWRKYVALHTASKWHIHGVKRGGVVGVRGSVDAKGLLENFAAS
jgi:hypothetical protein